MKTKLISFFLSFVMIAVLCAVPVSATPADDGSYEEDIYFINALGLGEINPENIDKPITRREAVLLSMGLYLGEYIVFDYNGEFIDISADDENAGKLALAVKNGIVSATADGKFVPDGKVSYIDAIKMVFNSLNYGPYVQSTGQGDVRYHLLANEYDVNVSPKASSALTVGEMAHLVAMAAEAPYMVIKSADQNGDIQYDKSQNVTALSFNYGIETIEATVTQNEFTSLYNKTALIKKGITLGSVSLNCNENTDTRDLLGKKIKAYYLEKTKDMLYYKLDDTQKIVALSADDIKDFNTATHTYYYYSGNSTKTHRVNANAAYIYNGVALTSAEAALILAGDIFTPSSGYVELIGSGSNFDCVKITDYKTYVVSGVDITGQKIIDKYGLAPLDYYSCEKLSIHDNEGNPISFEYIDKDNILLVEQSLCGTAVNIIVCADAVEGVINSYSDGIIRIEGEIFEASDILKKRISGYNSLNPNNIISIDVGRGVASPRLEEYVVLYLDGLGKVADYKISANSGWKYGYLFQKSSLAMAQEMEPKLKVKMLNDDNEVAEINIAKNFTMDGTKYTKYIDSYHQIITPTLVRYRLNPKGEIKEIDNPGTAADSTVPSSSEDASSLKEHYLFDADIDADYRDFTYVPSVSGVTFRHVSDSGKTTTKYFEKDALCFTVPSDPADTDEKNYAVTALSAFDKNSRFGGDVRVYWEDENEIVNTAIVRYASVSTSVSQNVYIVDKVTQAIDENGNNVWKLYLMNGGTIKEYTAPETGVYDSSNPLTCGDLIRISASGKREIKVIERTFDWENSSTFQIGQKDFGAAGTAKNPYSTEGYGVNDELYLLCGRAKRRSNNIMEVSYGAGLSEQFYLNGRIVVVEKAGSGYQLRIGTTADIAFDPSGTYSSRVVVDARYVVVRNVIVYK